MSIGPGSPASYIRNVKKRLRIYRSLGARPVRPAHLFLALALIAAACGGGGTDTTTTIEMSSDAEETSTTTTTPTGGEGDTTTTAAAESSTTSGAVGAGLNQALVSLEGDDYLFDTSPGTITDCNPDFFGSFWAIGESDDGGTITVMLPLDPNDPNLDPPSIRIVDVANDKEWIAEVTLIETSNYADVISDGDSQVNDYTVEGNSVVGNASFVEENAIFAALGGTGENPESVEGFFAVQCDSANGG